MQLQNKEDQDDCGWIIIKQWTQMNTLKTLKDWLKIDVNGELALRHVNLLI